MTRVILNYAGNTRVITQTALQKFQEEMGKTVRDPTRYSNKVKQNGWLCFNVCYFIIFKVFLKKTGIPISLLNERKKV